MRLIIEGLNKSYNKNKVLENLSYTFEEGKVYGILGRNGAGKTTLFNCIYNNLTYDNGSILLEEDGKISPINYKDVAMVFSQPTLPSFLTGYEFISFFINFNGIKGSINILEYFKLFGFKEGEENKLIVEYSHGMKSKLNLMATIIMKPKVMLLDEPLTSLDLVAAADIKRILLDYKKDTILLFSTHILQLAQDLCDEVVMLKDKKLEYIDVNKLSPKFEEEIVQRLRDDK